MSNKEFQEKLEYLTEYLTTLLKVCDYDKDRIPEIMWNRLCNLCKEIREYL